MDATLTAVNESQWILCLFQITILMSISWIVGRIALNRFPDISASVGVVALAVSSGLIALTWAEVPRPFQFSVYSGETARVLTNTKLIPSPVENLGSTISPRPSPPSWFGRLNSMLNWTGASVGHNGVAESEGQWFSRAWIAAALLWLTLLGGLLGVFRFIHSSITIHGMARYSSPIEDAQIRAEVMRILALLPLSHQHKATPVRQYAGTGSPFVSWLTGRTIFVPESF